MKLHTIAALAGALAISGVLAQTAEAREPGMPRAERTFERLDKNKDGALALEELEAKSVRRFMRLDADKNDQVTRAELESWLNAIAKRRIERILSRMDADKDASVSRNELRGYISGVFTEADTDKSGGVTLQESREYHVAKRRKRSEARKAASATRQ
jgi:Ca2+-binding EF-hand superfamily protein